jgi:hypothetical protein
MKLKAMLLTAALASAGCRFDMRINQPLGGPPLDHPNVVESEYGEGWLSKPTIFVYHLGHCEVHLLAPIETLTIVPPGWDGCFNEGKR